MKQFNILVIREEREGNKKMSEEIIAKNFDEKYKPTEPRSSMKPKHEKQRKLQKEQHHILTA